MSLTDVNIDIKSLKGVTQDSREVGQGYLFAALKGNAFDGRNYIDDAIKRGASVILSYEDTQIKSGVTSILVKNPRKTFSHIVSEFYQNQPEHIVAVTGTNGKSSVVHFIDQIWQNMGKSGAFIGTLSGAMTTPDTVSLHKKLYDLHENKITNLAIEASSHGLEQYRMDGVSIKIAAFTNLSQDHLDYHGNMDDYISAKMRLFSKLLDKDGVAILNADIPEYEKISSICKARILSYGENAKDVKLISRAITCTSQQIEIQVMGKGYSLNLPLIGKFQAMNALCALACIYAQYPEDIDKIIAALENLKGATGRLQLAKSNIYNAYIDYAHTPDALENVLNALRPHVKGRLICVFGCGGDRDKTKRPLMGDVAAKLADIVIVTDDNPRFENHADIRKDILSGANDNGCPLHEIADRREAIKFAVNQMKPEDILLIAGKGHEQGQIFGGHTEPFDDALEVEKLLSKKENKLND